MDRQARTISPRSSRRWVFRSISIIFHRKSSSVLARRVAIARAFAVKPDLLLLDEPFVSLDAALAAQLREELLALVLKRAATTLIVTHDVREAISLADRIIVLSAAPGRILADRTIEALTEAYAARLKDDIVALMVKGIV